MATTAPIARSSTASRGSSWACMRRTMPGNDLGIEIRVDPFAAREEFSALWESGWGNPWKGPLPNWKLSLVHLAAYENGRLVGYVNVATDGSGHAFLLDPTVHKDMQRRGLG